ncbi:MAG: DMT(drug/metabolite transporter) superfamily permease, partial [Thermoleophilia bacterium]|nr:DMT(drug/metabolite transporter) superfamily permease [Thermoleophilia bacterium]
MVKSSTSHTVILVATLLVTWLVWGSSFVAITWALDAFPPLLLMATRFVVAGTIATAAGLWLARRSGAALPCRRAWRDATVVGTGFITIGMGATGWAATRLPTGIAALLVASAPLWIALLQALFVRSATRSATAVAGLAVGIAGVGILVAPGLMGHGGIDATAALVLIASNGAWAAASLYSPRAVPAGGLVLGVGMQMLTGGTILLGIALAIGEGSRFSLAEMTSLALGGWTYLVLVGAIGGFLAYGWLLEHASATTASSHAFVNPLVAVALGALVLHEQVGVHMLIAGAAVIAAVVLLLVGETRAARRAEPAPTTAAPRPSTDRRRAAARPIAVGRGRGGAGWSPAPTPAFA